MQSTVCYRMILNQKYKIKYEVNIITFSNKTCFNKYIKYNTITFLNRMYVIQIKRIIKIIIIYSEYCV